MNIYQHFRKEEKEFIDYLIDKCDIANTNYQPVLLNFLDPREQYILKTIIGSYPELDVHFNGGTVETERKRAIVAPDYFTPTIDDFEMVLFRLDYPRKFVTLNHRNILGSIMSLGINRDQLGDIILNDEIQFVLTKRFESFIIVSLTKIKGATINLNTISFDNMIQSKEDWNKHDITTSALRLDVMVKHITNTSRTISKKLIDNGKVKVNHSIIQTVDFKVEVNDIISIKGYGRAIIDEYNGLSKKGKHRIQYRSLFK